MDCGSSSAISGRSLRHSMARVSINLPAGCPVGQFVRVMKLLLRLGLALNTILLPLHAWDYEGHRMVSQLALASLPTNFPAFTRTPAAVERVAFLAGEADRWRNSTNHSARHATGPDHYLDIDELSRHGLSPKTVSPFRYEFVAQLKLARSKNPEKFRASDPLLDSDHTRDLIGFLPWAINEHYAKLESAFSYLKTFELFGGTPEEITNAQQNVIYLMGLLGHFPGDAAQPLHTTKHYNGWLGDNPHRFTTNRTLHSWIDGGFVRRAEIRTDELKPKVRPARLIWRNGVADNDVFDESMQFVVEQFAQVERLYALERDGKLAPAQGDATEGRQFISAQLLKGAQFLGDLWYTAWKNAPIDKFLRGELTRRAPASDTP